FFFQAEDGIRDRNVTGVQTCALPISASDRSPSSPWMATPLEVDPGRAGGSIGAMLNVLTGFGVVVLIIGLGYVIGRKQLLGPKALYPLNMYVFWIALPATLLRFMSHADLGQIFGPNLAVVAISSLVTGCSSFALCYWIARRTAKESLIGMLAASYCNGSNLGIPLATYLLDDPTLTLPVILFQVGLYAPTRSEERRVGKAGRSRNSSAAARSSK